MKHTIRAALGLSLLAPAVFLACADPVVLPPGVDNGHEYGEDGDDNSAGVGAGAPAGPSSGPGAGPSSCDDPSTCEYDLEGSCNGQPVASPSSFPACPSSVCSAGGHCVPNALVPSDQAADLASCDSSSKCVPDRFIETGGKLTAPSCSSIGGAEGRCLSTCLPDVAFRAELLPSAGCDASEVCVPCFDPFDGTPSGACELSCDSGPAQPAKPLPACCLDKGGGTCLPSELLTPDEADRLDGEECAGLGLAASVCVPDQILNAFLVDVPFVPVECETSLLIQELGLGSEGGCLPECIPIVDALPVGQANCAAGFKCVPCIDLTGDGTGACDP